MNRLGLYLSPTPDHEGGFDRALWADREGFDDLWFPDGDGMRDAMTFAATVAGRTERVRLCTGITPVYTRVPAVIATSSLAVNRVAPGRFALGLGSSTHTMVENWYGVPFERPLARVRETTELVRKLFAGEKTRYQGDTITSRGFRLKEAIVGDVPIFLAGMGPKMLELAGELADGVILNHFTPLDRVPWALECVDRGAKRSGRRVEDLEIAQRVAVWVTDDDETAPAGSSGPISRSTAPPPSIGTSLRGWAIRTRRRRSGRASRSATGRASWPRCRTGRSSDVRLGQSGGLLPPHPGVLRGRDRYGGGGAAGHQRRGLRRDLRGVPPRRLPPRRRGITVNPGAPPQVLTLRQLPKPDDEGSGLHGSTTGAAQPGGSWPARVGARRD